MRIAAARKTEVCESPVWRDGWLAVLPATDSGGEGFVTQTGTAAFIEFLETQNDPDALLSFAREFGGLGLVERLAESVACEDWRTLAAEHIDSWHDAYNLIAWADRAIATLDDPEAARALVGIKAYEGLTDRERTALGRLEASGLLLTARVGLSRLAIDGKRCFRHSRWHPGSNRNETMPDERTLRDEHYVRFIRDALTDLINRMLRDHAAPQVRLHTSGGFTPFVVPVSLFGQMWAEMMLRLTGERKIIQCTGCGRWVDVTDGRSTRRFCHEPRGANCRKRYERAKKAG